MRAVSTAALLAAVTEAVFSHSLPWIMVLIGALIILMIIYCNRLFKIHRYIQISILGAAIGMYLPLSSSVPLFFGGMMAKFVDWCLSRKELDATTLNQHRQIGTLIACGLVAGSALMDVFLAIPFSLLHSPDALRLVGEKWETPSVFLGVFTLLMLTVWIKYRVCRTSR